MFGDLREDLGTFNSAWYRAHTAARQYHLSALGLPLDNRTVLELGAGIGDHTEFFVNRGCTVTVTDGRGRNVEILKERGYSDAQVLDVEAPGDFTGMWEIVYCYGLLYHLVQPYVALQRMAAWCSNLFLLETRVSLTISTRSRPEDPTALMHSIHGRNCDPAVPAIVKCLKSSFPYVYRAVTHPLGMAFDAPVDWVDPRGECRAVFVAARAPVVSRLLVIQ